jgi:perosamine synthetase
MEIQWASPSFGVDEERELLHALRSGWVSQGPKVKAFEEAIAQFLGVQHAVAVNNGTSALDVALKAMGVGRGDEVIVPDFTYIATANAVVYQGARPVLVDVDPVTMNIDPRRVREAITPRTKAIIPIDYGGCFSDWDALEKIAAEHGISLLQDAAHSIGGSYHGRRPGDFGVGGTLSFHTAKVMTSVEGGMFVTNDGDLANAARMLRNQGESPGKKYNHPVVGNNYRMSDLHGAIGLAQARKLPWLLRRRQEIVEMYRENLAGTPGLTLPEVPEGTEHPWFLFAVLFANRRARDVAEAALKAASIETRICFPMPIHKQEAYRDMHPPRACPVSQSVADRNLCLPLHPALDQRHISRVCNVLVETLKVAVR